MQNREAVHYLAKDLEAFLTTFHTQPELSHPWLYIVADSAKPTKNHENSVAHLLNLFFKANAA